jgi:hypothetical protein
MSKQIWKFPISDDRQTISVPEIQKSDVLTCQLQHGVLCLWIIVDTARKRKKYKVFTYGTGHPMGDESAFYVGTYQISDGDLIFHVFFEEIPNDTDYTDRQF